MFDRAGALKQPKDWDLETALAIARIDVLQKRVITRSGDGGESIREEVRLVRIAANDRLGALQQLMRHLNLFEVRPTPEGEPSEVQAVFYMSAFVPRTAETNRSIARFLQSKRRSVNEAA